MNMNQNDRELLEDVLDGFVASSADRHATSLTEWIRRYPQYEQELTEFAASWHLMQGMPAAPDAEAVTEDALVQRGMRVVQNLLVAPVAATAAAPEVQSLLAEGRAHGLSPRQLAQALGFGDSVLRKLDRRLIRFATIPHAAIERVAAAIQRDVTTVAQYLQQGPTLAGAAAHRSEEAPRLGEPEDFATAVRDDASMSESDRARWLELAKEQGQ